VGRRARPLEEDRASSDPVAVTELAAGAIDRCEAPATERRAGEEQHGRKDAEARGADQRERDRDEPAESNGAEPAAG
jgi:hypothetical protein